MNKFNTCPICNASDIHFLGSLVDRRKGLCGEWDYWRCSSCGVVFLNPMPDEEDLKSYYSSYYTGGQKISIGGYKAKYPLFLRKIINKITGDVDPRDFVRAKAGECILDYGCGTGTYLDYFYRENIDITGVELSEDIVKKMVKMGFKVKLAKDFSKLPFDDEEFDKIYLMQVFEHVLYPKSTLSEIRRILKPGGELYLALPNYNSMWRKFFGDCWVSGWFTPFHLYQYNKNSLETMVGMYGFGVEKAWSSTPDMWWRLNFKAMLNKNSNQIESIPSRLDKWYSRLMIVPILRFIELCSREKDCLVLKLVRYK